MLGLSLSLGIGTNPVAVGGGAPASTWNPLDKAASVTLTNSNLDAANVSGTYAGCRATNAKSTGKWYFEAKATDVTTLVQIGVANLTASLANFIGADTNSISEFSNGSIFYNNSNVGGTTGAWVTNDIMQCCFDADAGIVWFGRNNTFTGSPSAGTGGTTVAVGTYYPAFNAKSGSLSAKFTSASQTYSPPTGFSAIG